MNNTTGQNHLWSIILAGGNGERMRAFIERHFGYQRPKQYCTFIGTRSMFQHTLDRARRLTPPSRTVTVIAYEHQTDCWEQIWGRSSGRVLLQPVNRETAPGIFLPLTCVRAADPGATVVIYPADHFVYPEDRFMETVRQAALAADLLTDKVILLGAVPDHFECEYGWIQPGRMLAWVKGCPVREVQRFREKPEPYEAEAIRAAGGLWSTFVLAAKAETLWQLGWQFLPDMMALFDKLGDAFNFSDEGAVLNEIYRVMPALNFSSHFLQRIVDRLAVIQLSGVIWSDWGNPERIRLTLDRIAKSQPFPRDLLAAG